MIECLLSICKVLGSIPSNGKTYSVYQNGIANQEMPEVLFEVDFFLSCLNHLNFANEIGDTDIDLGTNWQIQTGSRFWIPLHLFV